MLKSRKTSLLDALNGTLVDERALLSSGNLRNLTPLTLRKTKLVDAISKLPDLNAGDFDALKSKMDHNQELLTAAVRAVRRVSGRKTKTAPLTNTYDTYTSSGDRHQIGDARRSTFERRS